MKESKSKVAVYLRVSTLDQESGLASQEQAIQDYLEGHGIEGVRWYRDRMSGATTKRPEFKRLQKDIFNGKVKTVIVWKLDRISRSLRDGINIMHDWLDSGVRIVAVAQQFDFSGHLGKIIAAFLLGLAEMERENLRENTKRGLLKARKQGKILGRPQTIRRDEVEAMIEEGMTISEIAGKLGVTRQGVHKALKPKREPAAAT